MTRLRRAALSLIAVLEMAVVALVLGLFALTQALHRLLLGEDV